MRKQVRKFYQDNINDGWITKIPQCTGNLLCNGKQKNCRLAESYLLVSARSSHHAVRPRLTARALLFCSMKKSDLIDLDKFSTWKTPEEINFLELLKVLKIGHKSEESEIVSYIDMEWLTWDVSGLNPLVYYWYEPRSKWNILQDKGTIDRDHQHNHVIDVILIERSACIMNCIHYQIYILP